MNMPFTAKRIPAYEPVISPIAHDYDRPAQEWERTCAAIGGFNPCSGRLTKICCVNDAFIGEHLDHITAAVEKGLVRRSTFAEQLFASQADFDDFVRFVRSYPGRIHDRWHQALAALAGIDAAHARLISTEDVLRTFAEV
ncbi:hypothetical protein HHL11_19320 [Ramlibacter sp. G-1-2-2]|uniref:Uncharacterized protein n=1 Tax=Ramlibacter agri TaxID=2728837 RepID=A0A848HEA7_9BURK|nr:hypothetical protein [Ramlibacter agri]NML45908.1 hypothetical protein [Ramlibacter agri]